MAIISTDPADWENANVLLIDSDARERKTARDEMDDWAYEHNFAMTPDLWLQQVIRRDGRRVYRGICYRLTQELRESNDRILQEVSERAKQLAEED